jgi:hypothetical protein
MDLAQFHTAISHKPQCGTELQPHAFGPSYLENPPELTQKVTSRLRELRLLWTCCG